MKRRRIFVEINIDETELPDKAAALSCLNCKTDLFVDARFCHACGYEAQKHCSKCDLLLPQSAQFCMVCGSEVPTQKELYQSQIKELKEKYNDITRNQKDSQLLLESANNRITELESQVPKLHEREEERKVLICLLLSYGSYDHGSPEGWKPFIRNVSEHTRMSIRLVEVFLYENENRLLWADAEFSRGGGDPFTMYKATDYAVREADRLGLVAFNDHRKFEESGEMLGVDD